MNRFQIILLSFTLTATVVAEDNGWVSLFDGKSLDGWEGNPDYWRVEDGIILGETTTGKQPPVPSSELVWQGGEVGDFELKVEFKINQGNTGVFYRAFPRKDSPWMVGGYQADFSVDKEWAGIAYGMAYKKVLAECGEKALVGDTPTDRKVIAMVGDRAEILDGIDPLGWNEYHIIARGNQVIQMLNGIVTAEFSESSEDRLRRGLLALQVHRGPPMQVKFRHVGLRRMELGDKKEILFIANKAAPDRRGWRVSQLFARALNESGLDVIAHVIESESGPRTFMEYQNPEVIVLNCSAQDETHSHGEWVSQQSQRGANVVCLDTDRRLVAPRDLQNDLTRLAILSGLVETAGVEVPKGGVRSRRPSDVDLTLN